jgi:hypothetical protein
MSLQFLSLFVIEEVYVVENEYGGDVSSSQAVTPSRPKLTRFVQSASANFKDGGIPSVTTSPHTHTSTPLFLRLPSSDCFILVLDIRVSACAVLTRALLTFNPTSLRLYPAPHISTPLHNDISIPCQHQQINSLVDPDIPSLWHQQKPRSVKLSRRKRS